MLIWQIRVHTGLPKHREKLGLIPTLPYDKFFNTQYMTNSTLVSPVKMEYG